MLKVTNYVLLAAYSDPAILIIIHCSSAFDTADHSILIGPLGRMDLQWGIGTDRTGFYLNGRSFSIVEACLSRMPISSGVQQGSIMGPLLFSIYILPHVNTFPNYNLQFLGNSRISFYIQLKPGVAGNIRFNVISL